MKYYEVLLIISVAVSAVILYFGYMNGDMIFTAFGLILLGVVLLMLYKRSRLPYWFDMAMHRGSVEKYLVDGLNDNNPKDIKLGRRIERLAIVVAYTGMGAGSIGSPFFGEYSGLIMLGSFASALVLFSLKFVFGYFEKMENMPKHHLTNFYEDLDGNPDVEFYERYQISENIFTDGKQIQRFVEEEERSMRIELDAMVKQSSLAYESLEPTLANQLQELRKEAKEYEDQLKEKLKASKILQKYFNVGIDTDPDNTEDKDKDQKPLYEPNIYTFYPDGDPKRRRVICFPVSFSKAVDLTNEERVRFDFVTVMTKHNTIGSIKLGTLEEVLFNGDIKDGVPIDLPEGIEALDTKVPFFVATEFDFADQQRRKGIRMPKPPPIVDHVIKLIKSVTDSLRIGLKLEDKDIQIKQLEDSNERMKRMIQAGKVRDKLDKPLVLPIGAPDTEYDKEEEREISLPMPLIKKSILFLSGFILGTLVVYLLLPALGWTLTPPMIASGGSP